MYIDHGGSNVVNASTCEVAPGVDCIRPADAGAGAGHDARPSATSHQARGAAVGKGAASVSDG